MKARWIIISALFAAALQATALTQESISDAPGRQSNSPKSQSPTDALIKDELSAFAKRYMTITENDLMGTQKNTADDGLAVYDKDTLFIYDGTVHTHKEYAKRHKANYNDNIEAKLEGYDVDVFLSADNFRVLSPTTGLFTVSSTIYIKKGTLLTKHRKQICCTVRKSGHRIVIVCYVDSRKRE